MSGVRTLAGVVFDLGEYPDELRDLAAEPEWRVLCADLSMRFLQAERARERSACERIADA